MQKNELAAFKRRYIGAKIQEARLQRKLSQERLADLLKIRSVTVSRWETGVYLPTYELRAPLCDELGLDRGLFVLDNVPVALCETEAKPESPVNARRTPLFKIYRGWRPLEILEPGLTRRSITVTVNNHPLPHYPYSTINPPGYEWGYEGAGPRHLAESILADYFEETERLWRNEPGDYQTSKYTYDFKMDCVRWFPREPEDEWSITSDQITQWTQRKEAGVIPAWSEPMARDSLGWVVGWEEGRKPFLEDEPAESGK